MFRTQTPFRASRPAPRGGFSLIELLVVIGILGILATLVSPVVGRAMDSARVQHCRNNLKQLHAGVLSYVQDHGIPPAAQAYELTSTLNGITYYRHDLSWGWVEWVPDDFDPDKLETPWNKDNTVSHSSEFRDDLGTGRWAQFAIENGALFDYVGDINFYACPLVRKKFSTEDAISPDSDVSMVPSGRNVHRTYAMNAFFKCSGSGSERSWPIGRKASLIGVPNGWWYGGHVPEPAKLLLFTEIQPSFSDPPKRTGLTDKARGGSHSSDACLNPDDWNQKDEALYACHPSRKKQKGSETSALAIFYDGHIETVEPFKGAGNTAWFLNRGWTPDSQSPL